LGDDVHEEEPAPSTHDAEASYHGHSDDSSVSVHSDSSILDVPEVYQIVFTEYQSVLFSKVMSYMEISENQVEKVYLKPLQGSNYRKMIKIVKDMNIILLQIPILSLTNLCKVIYCAACVVTEECIRVHHISTSFHKSQPAWEIHLVCKLRRYKQDLSCLLALESGQLLSQRKVGDLTKQYSLNNRSIVVVCEEIRQSIKALSHRLSRYRQKRSCRQQNLLFTTNQHKFYRTQLGSQEACAEPPQKDNTLKFWNELWGTPVYFNKKASWLSSMCRGVNMSFSQLSFNDLNRALKRFPNWKSPGN